MDASEIEQALSRLSTTISEFEPLSSVPELHATLSADAFRAAYVERNTPCVIRGAASHWRAVSDWSLRHLAESMGETPVTCTFTPDGRADAVKAVGDAGEPAFVLPHNEQRTLASFAELFWRTQREQIDCVPSVQFQNSNLAEFGASLASDTGLDMAWAAQAFGTGQPDATNIWVGDSRSVTSFHKVCAIL